MDNWILISGWTYQFGKKTVPYIVEFLSKENPKHADEFQVNGEKVMKEMEIVHGEIKALMHTIPSKHRYLVTSHDAFNYFTRSYLADEDELREQTWKERLPLRKG